VPSIRRILPSRDRGGGASNRFHYSARAGQGGGAQSHQAAGPRSGPHLPGSAEPAVVHRLQSAAQSVGRSGGGTAPGSGEAFSALQWLVIRMLGVYKVCISPALPSACRFHPTCSEYMGQAVERYGAARGVWMGIRRLARCHPFHAGGFDPVGTGQFHEKPEGAAFPGVAHPLPDGRGSLSLWRAATVRERLEQWSHGRSKVLFRLCRMKRGWNNWDPQARSK